MDADPLNTNVQGATSEGSPPSSPVNLRSRAPFDVLYPESERDDQPIEVDIVAVHGLGANVDWSWTWRDKARPSSTVNWLKDPHMLPKVVPNSRIMVYNYDSRWHADAPRTRLQICGEEFVRNLHTFREGQQDRPVVFIGHSLGGLVIQHAVPEESACITGWDRAQLQTDHTKLNKFSGPRDRSFLSVSAKVLAMCSTPKSMVERQTKNVVEHQTEPKGHWMVPFERNEAFVGREDVLQLLLDRIPPSANQDMCQRTAIEGLGGVGKTQLALEAAFRLRRTHPSCSVFWVPAIDASTFEKAYRGIGRLLGVSGIDESQADIKALVNAALSQVEAGQWLLVIDNADDPSLMFGPTGLSTCFPSSMNGSLLLTTRTREVAVRLDIPGTGILRTTKMSREEAMEMIAERLTESQMQDTASITGLLDFLDDLPLAIKQASNFMYATGMTTARYLEHCRSSDTISVNLLSQDFEDRGRYDTIKNPVATTWLISFEHISRDNPQAGEYLRFMCFLAEKDIPISLLPLASDEIEAEKAIGTLDAYGFVTRRKDGMSIDMHRLVRLAMRNWLLKEGQVQQEYVRVIQRVEEMFPHPVHENREVWMKYIAQAQSALESEVECGTDEATAELLTKVGNGLYWLGSYQHAGLLLQRSVDMSEKVLGREHQSTLTSMNNLALTLLEQGKYEDAEKTHRKTLELMEQVLGKEHQSTLTSMNNLALTLLEQGKYEDAEKTHRKTLELREQALGKEHPDTLTSMNNLALALQKQGKYEDAERIQRKTLELMEQVLSKEHPDTLASMNNLALALLEQGKYEDAEKTHRKTLELKEQVLGKEHPDTLASMNNLALALLEQGKYEDAERIQRKTLELKEQVLGKEHPDTLASMNNLALALLEQGKYEDAERIQRKTLELKEQVLGREHQSTLTSMNNLALTLLEQGKYEDAEKTHRKTLELREQVLGKEHPDTLTSMNNLAWVLADLGQVQEAEKLYRRTTKLLEKVLGINHPHTLTSKRNLAGLLAQISHE
ncbi:hypothetical protein EDB81DRAFT_913094 [Dactylonectria macrodidyma]|uniref:Kinesin light chain n=1 Tax=Dactylonectria macrodidyma TaxID=307937 RepID=A0A9P9DLP6_9HYPO|nr:hypothetical protein EDB81DRAFT_913094 [Dactylonectria macrodidyma]